MAAAGLAPLPVAPLMLVVLADLVFSLGHLDRLGLPEREGVDRAGGPAPAGGAMTIASALRIPRDFNRDGAAIALPFEGLFILAHEFSVSRGLVVISPRQYPAQSAAFHTKQQSGSPRHAGGFECASSMAEQLHLA